MSIQPFLGIERVWGGQDVNSTPWEMKGAYPSRAALVSLLTVFVLLSALFFSLLLPRLHVLKQAVGVL